MKSTLILGLVLALCLGLVSLAKAQPAITAAPLQVQKGDQLESLSERPADIEAAALQFIHQEAEDGTTVEPTTTHSRQKRAACRCYRRSPTVIICYCR